MMPGDDRSFVLFPLGVKRFALPAAKVTELAKPDRLQKFPHRTRLMTGVLVRRGKIVPVCDVANVLVGPDAPPRKFYLIAYHQLESGQEGMAIPVTGECELANGDMVRPPDARPSYISGLIMAGGEAVEVVNLEKLIAAEVAS